MTEMILCRPIAVTSAGGSETVECTQCETRFPMPFPDKLSCNGRLYDDCPYCRPKYDEEQALAEAKAIKEMNDYGAF